MAQVNIYSAALPPPTHTHTHSHTCLITHQASHVPTKDMQLHPSSYTSTHTPRKAVIHPATEQHHPQDHKNPHCCSNPKQWFNYDIRPVTHSLRHRGCADCNQNVSRFGLAVRCKQRDLGSNLLAALPFLQKLWSVDTVL